MANWEMASKYSNKVGPLVYFVSVFGVSFDHYIPSIIPSKIIDGMYWSIAVSCLGMAWFFMNHLGNPHLSIGQQCPKCQKPILYTGIKCSNPDCDYVVKF